MKEATINTGGTAHAVIFVPGVVDGIEAHCNRQATLHGAEAVGFMARKHTDEGISSIMPLNNHSSDPQHGFYVEAWEQYRAERKLDEQGYKICGVYHSHPTGEALPSRADRELARPGEYMAIYSVAFDELKVWLEKEGDLVPVMWMEQSAGL